jgi:hypothetical protein
MLARSREASPPTAARRPACQCVESAAPKRPQHAWTTAQNQECRPLPCPFIRPGVRPKFRKFNGRNSCNRIHGYPINRIWTTAHAGTPLPCPVIDAESRRQPAIRAPGTPQNRAVGPDDRLLDYRKQNRNRRTGSIFAYRHLGIQKRLWLDLRGSTWNKNRSFVSHSRFVKRPI